MALTLGGHSGGADSRGRSGELDGTSRGTGVWVEPAEYLRGVGTGGHRRVVGTGGHQRGTNTRRR